MEKAFNESKPSVDGPDDEYIGDVLLRLYQKFQNKKVSAASMGSRDTLHAVNDTIAHLQKKLKKRIESMTDEMDTSHDEVDEKERMREDIECDVEKDGSIMHWWSFDNCCGNYGGRGIVMYLIFLILTGRLDVCIVTYMLDEIANFVRTALSGSRSLTFPEDFVEAINEHDSLETTYERASVDAELVDQDVFVDIRNTLGIYIRDLKGIRDARAIFATRATVLQGYVLYKNSTYSHDEWKRFDFWKKNMESVGRTSITRELEFPRLYNESNEFQGPTLKKKWQLHLYYDRARVRNPEKAERYYGKPAQPLPLKNFENSSTNYSKRAKKQVEDKTPASLVLEMDENTRKKQVTQRSFHVDIAFKGIQSAVQMTKICESIFCNGCPHCGKELLSLFSIKSKENYDQMKNNIQNQYSTVNIVRRGEDQVYMPLQKVAQEIVAPTQRERPIPPPTLTHDEEESDVEFEDKEDVEYIPPQTHIGSPNKRKKRKKRRKRKKNSTKDRKEELVGKKRVRVGSDGEKEYPRKKSKQIFSIDELSGLSPLQLANMYTSKAMSNFLFDKTKKKYSGNKISIANRLNVYKTDPDDFLDEIRKKKKQKRSVFGSLDESILEIEKNPGFENRVSTRRTRSQR